MVKWLVDLARKWKDWKMDRRSKQKRVQQLQKKLVHWLTGSREEGNRRISALNWAVRCLPQSSTSVRISRMGCLSSFTWFDHSPSLIFPSITLLQCSILYIDAISGVGEPERSWAAFWHLVLSRNARFGTYCQIIRNALYWAFSTYL